MKKLLTLTSKGVLAGQLATLCDDELRSLATRAQECTPEYGELIQTEIRAIELALRSIDRLCGIDILGCVRPVNSQVPPLHNSLPRR